MQIIKIHEYFKIRFIFRYYRLPFFFLHKKTDLSVYQMCDFGPVTEFFEYYFPHF